MVTCLSKRLRQRTAFLWLQHHPHITAQAPGNSNCAWHCADWPAREAPWWYTLSAAAFTTHSGSRHHLSFSMARLQVALPEDPPWWTVFHVKKPDLIEVACEVHSLYQRPKAAYIPLSNEAKKHHASPTSTRAPSEAAEAPVGGHAGGGADTAATQVHLCLTLCSVTRCSCLWVLFWEKLTRLSIRCTPRHSRPYSWVAPGCCAAGGAAGAVQWSYWSVLPQTGHQVHSQRPSAPVGPAGSC